MGYSEHLGIILMRDNGPRRSFRFSRRLFYGLLIFFACLPLVCAGLVWHGYTLFQKNAVLASLLEQRDAELEVVRASAKRLEDLAVLLQENTLEGREQIIHRLALAEDAKARASQAASSQPVAKSGAAKSDTAAKHTAQPDRQQGQTDKRAGNGAERSSAENAGGKLENPANAQPGAGQSGLPTLPAQESKQENMPEQAAAKQVQNSGNGQDDGPGHEEIQEIDEHFVRVSNVQARAFAGNRLRIAIDLHNTEKQDQAIGSVRATLLTDAGNRHQIVYEQKDAGDFRINRFKRAVMLSKIPHEYRLTNSQIQIEVFMQDGSLVYRNIYSVER